MTRSDSISASVNATNEGSAVGTPLVAEARAIIDIITGTWRAQALHAMAALGIADLIADGHADVEDIAKQIGTTPDRLERLMRLMTSMGVVTGDSVARSGYRLTGIGELLRDVPGMMRDLVLVSGEEFHRAWGAFQHAITTGQPGFTQAFGLSLHEHLGGSPVAAARFQAAMAAGNVFFAAVPDVFDFTRCSTVVDVGGGAGALLGTVLQASPATHGVLLDRPPTTTLARQQLAEALPTDRFDVVDGDMFRAVPPDADVYLLSRVLQDWDDEACGRLLTAIRNGMHESSRLLIVERVAAAVVTTAAPQLPLLYDLHLLTMAGGGQRTLAGYRTLLAGGGLYLEAIYELPLEATLLVVTRQ
jgi:hypothetical protein